MLRSCGLALILNWCLLSKEGASDSRVVSSFTGVATVVKFYFSYKGVAIDEKLRKYLSELPKL